LKAMFCKDSVPVWFAVGLLVLFFGSVVFYLVFGVVVT